MANSGGKYSRPSYPIAIASLLSFKAGSQPRHSAKIRFSESRSVPEADNGILSIITTYKWQPLFRITITWKRDPAKYYWKQIDKMAAKKRNATT